MKGIFKMGLTTLLMLGIQWVGQTQPQNHPMPSPDEMAKHETGWMTTELKLTDDQQVKVQQVNLTFANKMKEQFESGERPDPSVMQKMDEEKNKALKEILTDDQYTTYLEKRKEHSPGPKSMPDRH